MDLTLVKAELKSWERDFKSKHGRDPSKADIKAVPEIAEKYRLYSKARADKPPSASLPSKPAPSRPAAPPVTPSKRAARDQQQEDTFKTPSRSSASRTNGAAHNAAANGAAQSPTANGTQFAYAPSPSRLRALAASRSFSGSPNKKGGLAAQEAGDAGQNAPRNLGKAFVLPPTVDTPRTKAKRWLAGDAVSPPVKLRYTAQASAVTAPQASTSKVQAPQKRANSSKAGFWQQVEQRRSVTPAEDTERAEAGMLEDTKIEPGQSNNDHIEDEDFLAPSPVKPSTLKANGKGKQRQRIDLFGDTASESTTSTSNGINNVTIPSKKITATPITSFFSAKPPLSRPPTISNEEYKKPYLPGQSKAKKRTIAVAALTPTVSEDFDKIDESDVAPIQIETNSRSKRKVENGSTKLAKKVSQEDAAGSSDRTKRLRKETTTVQQEIDDEAAMQEEEVNPYDDAYDPEVFEALEAQEDDYETRDLSDEYDEYKPRMRAMTPAVLSQTRESSTAPLDDSLDPDLVSLLSLKASPVKNRLARLHKKREDTYRKLLHEPTYILETQRRITGLEDLEEEEQRKREAELEECLEATWSTELPEDGKHKVLGTEQVEQSDDDWASEPEGWKELSDGEMPDDSF